MIDSLLVFFARGRPITLKLMLKHSGASQALDG